MRKYIDIIMLGIFVTALILAIALSAYAEPLFPNGFTDLDKGQCSYWNHDISPSKYIPINCSEWLNIVMDNPSSSTECILRKCPTCQRHFPNVTMYKGKWSVLYGYTSDSDSYLYDECNSENNLSNSEKTYTLDDWADAIFKAENSKNHPYGIMLKGCTKDTPEFCRKACKRTVENTLIKYRNERCKDGEGDLECLSRRYCPINSDTDNGTCQFWNKNVNFYLRTNK